MSEDANALLREIRDLMREQNALIGEMRDMNKESMQRLRSSQDRNEQLIERTERLHSKTERTFTVSNVVVYGAAFVVLLLLFSFFRRPW